MAIVKRNIRGGRDAKILRKNSGYSLIVRGCKKWE
jgi:hypothetical protein